MPIHLLAPKHGLGGQIGGHNKAVVLSNDKHTTIGCDVDSVNVVVTYKNITCISSRTDSLTQIYKHFMIIRTDIRTDVERNVMCIIPFLLSACWKNVHVYIQANLSHHLSA